MNDDEMAMIKEEQRRQRTVLSFVSSSLNGKEEAEKDSNGNTTNNTQNVTNPNSCGGETKSEGDRNEDNEGASTPPNDENNGQLTGGDELQTTDTRSNLSTRDVTNAETTIPLASAEQVRASDRPPHRRRRPQTRSSLLRNRKTVAGMIFRFDDANYSSDQHSAMDDTSGSYFGGPSSSMEFSEPPPETTTLQRQLDVIIASESAPGAYRSSRGRRVSTKGTLTVIPDLEAYATPPPQLRQVETSFGTCVVHDSEVPSAQELPPTAVVTPADLIHSNSKNGESGDEAKTKRTLRFLKVGMVLLLVVILAIVLGVGFGAGVFGLNNDNDGGDGSGVPVDEPNDISITCTNDLWEFYNTCQRQSRNTMLSNPSEEEQPALQTHCGTRKRQYAELKERLSMHVVTNEASCDSSNLALLALTEWTSVSGLYTTVNISSVSTSSTPSVVSLLDMFAITTLSFATGGPQAWDTNHNYTQNDSSNSNNNSVIGYFHPEQLCGWEEDRVVECNCTNQGDDVDVCYLTSVDISWRGLGGTLPSQIGLLTSAEALHVPLNLLTGSIPSEIGMMTSLREVVLELNHLTGGIPSEIGLLTNLRYLNVGKLRLSGSLPSEIGQIEPLQVLIGKQNDITGQLPSELFSLEKLEYLDLTINKLEGSLSSDIGRLSKLRYLDLTTNGLSGLLPSELSRCTDLTAVQLGHNEFSGTIPSEYQSLTNLVVLSLSSNRLAREPIPNMTAWKNLEYLNLHDIRLTGTLPDSMWLLTKLRVLDLSSTFLLSGTLPSSIENLQSLEYLKLDANRLRGVLPSEIGLLTNLRSILLGLNDFTGTLPTSFGQLENLEDLHLGENELEGEIPPEVCQLWDYSLQSLGWGQPSCSDLLNWLGGLTCPSFDCCRVCEHLFP